MLLLLAIVLTAMGAYKAGKSAYVALSWKKQKVPLSTRRVTHGAAAKAYQSATPLMWVTMLIKTF